MRTREIFGNSHRYLPLKRKVFKLALEKNLSFDETIILCLAGASTRQGTFKVNPSKPNSFGPKGGSTHQGGKNENR